MKVYQGTQGNEHRFNIGLANEKKQKHIHIPLVIAAKSANALSIDQINWLLSHKMYLNVHLYVNYP